MKIYVGLEGHMSGESDSPSLREEGKVGRVFEKVRNIAGIDIEMSVWPIEWIFSPL